MKILLINPTNGIPINSSFVVNIFQPLGLAYVAASLKKHKYKVQILDALALDFENETIRGDRTIIGMDYEAIKKRIKKYNPDIVGIATPFSFQSHEAHQMARLAKEVNPKIITIAGGSHATIQPEEMLQDKNVDFLIRGEGEYAIVEFVKAIEKKKSFKNIKSLSYKNRKGEMIHNPKDLPIKDLDSLAMPARDLLPMEQYHKAAKTGRVIEGMLEFGQKKTSLYTSRGCPFNCTFCSVHLTMTRTWRARSPEDVMKEINNCVHKHGIRYFDVLDDNFTFNTERAKKICQMIIDSKLDIRWSTPNGIRADTVDEELVILMKKAGCIQVKVAPESGSKRVITEVIKKFLSLEKVSELVKLCKKHDLSVEAFFVIGFPEETEAEIWETINYGKELRRLGCDHCYFFIATPYFGTVMYSEAVERGYLDISDYNLNDINTTTDKSLMKSPNYTPERLLQLQHIANRINPPLSRMRLISGIKMGIQDPVRFFKYVVAYTKYFLPQ